MGWLSPLRCYKSKCCSLGAGLRLELLQDDFEHVQYLTVGALLLEQGCRACTVLLVPPNQLVPKGRTWLL